MSTTKLEAYHSPHSMASTQGDDDTARKLRHLQDYTNAHSDKQQEHPPSSLQHQQTQQRQAQQLQQAQQRLAQQQQQQPTQPQPQQHLPQIQRTHAGFQAALGPAGEQQGHHPPPPPHASGQPPHPHHHNQLPPMVDPQLGGGQHLAPIQSPPGSHASIPSMLQQSPESALDNDRKGRQLSTTKRAAQNRAAQRAFRQRKEIHIKNLEAKVQDIEPLKNQIEELQRDNYTLRGYLITMLEMIAKKGLEPPPNIPKMHMDPNAFNPSSMSLDQQGSEQNTNGSNGASVDHDMGRTSDFPSSLNNPGAPTAPMQDIAQQVQQAVSRDSEPRDSSSS